ncbi:hypothetical protein Hte_001508 [Hypoxylon texense]
MEFKVSVIIALGSLLLSPSTRAAPATDDDSVPLRDQITALDKAGQIQWEEVEGGRVATIAPPNHQGRDDIFQGFPDPVKWLSSQWNDHHTDVKIEGNPGRTLCVGGGSRMLESIIDNGAKDACNYFVGRSTVGQLGLMVWHAYEQKDHPTDQGPGFIRWLMGSVSNSPTELTEEFCNDMWDAVKSQCLDGETTQGQAISAGDWTLYADPNKNNGD